MTVRSLLRRGLVRRLPAPSARPAGPRILGCNLSLQGEGPSAANAPRFATVHPTRHLSSTSAQTLERRRRAILTAALRRVHDEGWTDDALASATLDAGLPPSYIGQATTAASPFGSADLVAFFMDECHAALRKELAEGQPNQQGKEGVDKSVEEVSSRIHTALQARLAMVLPYVASNRWHEGMAIGALPQNAYRTARQLDDMANTVLDYAVGKDVDHNPAQRAAVVAAYAAAELHLLSDGQDGTVSGSSLSLSGEQYQATWAFLEGRCVEVARLIVDGIDVPYSLPNPTHIMAASAVASSLAGAALSLAAPSAAAVAGHVLPRAMESVLTPLQNVVGSQMNKQGRDLTRPSDYAVDTDTLPPFDASEEIFSGSAGGKAS
ncbi:hypothetical protein ACHAXT_001308 [Thalassiosira profunda]